jgi:hypothetical protein
MRSPPQAASVATCPASVAADASAQRTSQTTYLFQCGDEGLFAVTHDASGSNIPRSSCTQGWRLNETFQLRDRTVAPTAADQEAMRRGIVEKGFYIWRTSDPST